jgi:hypothetical protein
MNDKSYILFCSFSLVSPFLLTFCGFFSKPLIFVPELLQTGTFANFYLR